MTSHRDRELPFQRGRGEEFDGCGRDDPDAPPGYWKGRWVEFKRLWLLSWHQSAARETLALAVALIVIGFVIGFIEKFS